MAASNNAMVSERRLLPMTMLSHSMGNLSLCMAAFLYHCIALRFLTSAAVLQLLTPQRPTGTSAGPGPR